MWNHYNYKNFSWQEWGSKPANAKLIAESMSKAVSKFRREQFLWEQKFEYLQMAYNLEQQDANTSQQNAGTSTLADVEAVLANYAIGNDSAANIEAMAITAPDADTYLASTGILAQAAGDSSWRPVFKIYS